MQLGLARAHRWSSQTRPPALARSMASCALSNCRICTSLSTSLPMPPQLGWRFHACTSTAELRISACTALPPTARARSALSVSLASSKNMYSLSKPRWRCQLTHDSIRWVTSFIVEQTAARPRTMGASDGGGLGGGICAVRASPATDASAVGALGLMVDDFGASSSSELSTIVSQRV